MGAPVLDKQSAWEHFLRLWMCSKHLTSDNKDEVLGCAEIAGVPDDVKSLVFLLHIFQHQVAQRVDQGPGIHHLAFSQQNNLRGMIVAGSEHNLTNIPRWDINVDVLPKEGFPVFLFNCYKQ